MLRVLTITAATLMVLFATITLIALEGSEVVVLETRRADGTLRSTRVWLAREGDTIWLEAPTAERPWYRDVLRDPHVRLRGDQGTVTYVARALPTSGGHRKIRALLREKYGLADRWVGLLQDTSDSIAVRLLPVPSR